MRDATVRFAEVVRRPEPDVPLDEAVLLIAAHAYPDLDVEEQKARLDEMARSCPEASFHGLRHHLFEELGFTGNVRNYADPRNSFLNDVLDRRVGIPISLSVLTMEVGRRIGVAVHGVGMPGHFLVRHGADGPLLDPFSHGRVLDEQSCEALFRAVHGPEAAFGPELLAPVGPRAVLTRVLGNLRRVYSVTGDVRSAGWAQALRATIPAETPYELADLAGAQEALGRFAEAAGTLTTLADVLGGPAAARARAEAGLLRSRLN